VVELISPNSGELGSEFIENKVVSPVMIIDALCEVGGRELKKYFI
jgi:hypothetical protein